VNIILLKNFVESIVDVEYEQVIADRYLFSPYSNETNYWIELKNVEYAWQVASLPEYHNQSSEGFFLLLKRNELFEICYMSIYENGSLINLSEIPVNNNGSYLVSSNDKDFNLALISPNDIQLIQCNQYDVKSCRVKNLIPFPSSIIEKTKKISSGLFVSDMDSMGWLYIGSNSGLHGLNLQTLEITININEINDSVSSLAWSSKYQTIFIGTETKLWIENYSNQTKTWRFEHVNGLIDSPISSLVYDNTEDKLWIGQDTGITHLIPIKMSTGRLHWYFSRLSGEISNPGSYIGHLPYANITCLSVTNSNPSDNCVWLGSVYGLMRYNSKSSEMNQWRVFNSGRYLPNRFSEVNVSSLTVLNRIKTGGDNLGSTAIAITNRGLSIIRFEMWTLKKKAEFFQKYIDETNRHVRYNLVSSCGMSKWGDPTSCIRGPDDNDGLWTSMYLSSQIFRYVVTNDTNVKQSSWKYFQGLYSLNEVTGISGYPSRSIAKRDEFPPDPDWHLSPVNSSLQFKGDTSSDEIVGHQYVYPLMHDFISDTDIQRQLVYSILFNITNHILTHNWYLIGEYGNHTTWGIWNPKEMNNDPFYQETRGLNSLQILAFLFQIYAYSGDQRFLNGINTLINQYQYDVNLINQKIIAVCDGSFSDDELAYLAYFNLIYAFNSIKLSNRMNENLKLLINNLEEYVFIGLDLSHKYKQMEKSPFYNFIYCYIYNQMNKTSSLFDCQVLANDSIWYLQRFPLELVNWPQFNSQRLDLHINQFASCSSDNKYSLKLLPPDERTIHKWNNGPYDLDDGDGFSEEDPTVFLLSYWGMTFARLLDFN
jgi:hypothetical protein